MLLLAWTSCAARVSADYLVSMQYTPLHTVCACFDDFISQYSKIKLLLAHTTGSKGGMVDVPRFELGASSMPRKRASRLRHTPSGRATDDGHLRRMGHAVAWSGTENEGE